MLKMFIVSGQESSRRRPAFGLRTTLMATAMVLLSCIGSVHGVAVSLKGKSDGQVPKQNSDSKAPKSMDKRRSIDAIDLLLGIASAFNLM